MWEQREDMLWLRKDYWPPKREIDRPSPPSSLTPAQQEQAIMLIRQGMSLRRVAELFETSYELIRRLAKGHGIELQSHERKLSSEQLEEAYALLRAGASLRKVAARFGISDESLRRLAKRDGVELSTQTPTERKLTPAQQEAARELVRSGVSLRQTAKRFGISRGALEGLLEDGDKQPQGPTLTSGQLQEAIALLNAGYSLRQTAKHFGTTHQTLIRYLKRGENDG